ncbi:MAG: hypothetical protein QGF90_16535 [Gammaproteobacteria bacterium]|nr:hypothetical protein [Gammaproteobacteria bacterium]
MSGPNHQQKPVTLGIGVDFGTSNSAAALFDGQNVHLVQLESDSTIMPSATYIDRDFKIVAGQRAIGQYIESNIGLKVELSAEVLARVALLPDKLAITVCLKK